MNKCTAYDENVSRTFRHRYLQPRPYRPSSSYIIIVFIDQFVRTFHVDHSHNALHRHFDHLTHKSGHHEDGSRIIATIIIDVIINYRSRYVHIRNTNKLYERMATNCRTLTL